MIRKAIRTAGRRLGPQPIDARVLQMANGAVFYLSELGIRAREDNEAAIRRLCSNYYLGGDTSMCRVLGRYKMLVDTQDFGVSAHLLADGFWEIWHTEAMLDLLKPGMKAVDIGANLGYFTMVMSDLVGESGSVHAFEPNQALVRRLRHSVEINGFGQRTTVHELALYDSAGESLLAIPENSPGGGHVIADIRGRTGTSIKLERFDAIPALADADYIKMDVEGAEHSVWRGMKTFLASGRAVTIVMEFTGARYQDPGGFIDEILASGFSLSLIEPEAGIVPTDRATLLMRPMVEQTLLLRR